MFVNYGQLTITLRIQMFQMKPNIIFTIGHSNHTADFFLELLNHFSIDCIVDVRSMAASRYSPQFNKENLEPFLNRNEIAYLHFAKEFGARIDNTALHDTSGKVDFEKVQQSPKFKKGVKRLGELASEQKKVALMCSEADPFDCHRFSMIAVYLEKNGFEVHHILKDRTIITNAALEKKMMEKYEKKLPLPDLFNPDVNEGERLRAAYRLRNKDVAYEGQ